MGLTKASRSRGEAALAIDLFHGGRRNVLREDVFDLVRQWVCSGMVAGLWLGTPCESFSRALRRRWGASSQGRWGPLSA